MPEVNIEWVKAQMDEAKVKVGVGTGVLKLLEKWQGIVEFREFSCA